LKACLSTLLILTVLATDLPAQEASDGAGAESAGKWRIVSYWSEWCAPCRKEIPVLNELNAQLASSAAQVAVVGVDFDENPRAESLAIAERMGIEFPILTINDVRQLQLSAPSVMPTIYILSPENQIVAKLIGEQTRTSLYAELARLNLIDPPAANVLMLSPPIEGNSSLSRLVSDDHGGIYLSWVSSEDEMSTLSWSKWAGDTWQAPQEIACGNDWFVNWADFPSLAVNGESKAAHWLRMSARGAYDYDVMAGFYHPESQSWGVPITVNKDGVSAEHGFVSMLPLSGGRYFIAWLDGRNTRADGVNHEASGSDGHSMGGAMTLRAGTYDGDGKNLQEWQLDGRVCDCCQTSAALAASGPVVVYRDRSEEEIRDVYITRWVNGEWTEPRAVHHDGWKIAGCPVNGPAVAALKDRVAVAWFSARDDSPEVKLALSGDGGASFSEPVMVAEGTTNGRVGLAFLASGNVALSWMDTRGESAQLMLALYDVGGRLVDQVQVAESQASRRSGFPVIASAGDDVYMTWTDIAVVPQVKVARIRF